MKDIDLSEFVVIVNPWIHKKAKLSRQDFLQKISNVEYLRTCEQSIPLILTSLEHFNFINKIYKLVNEGIFDLRFNNDDEEYTFVVAMHTKFYNWFKTNTLSAIQKQIICWIAGLYQFNPDIRENIKIELYSLLYEEMIEVINRFYSDFELPQFDEFYFDNPECFWQKKDEINGICQRKYIDVCHQFYNSDPPDFLYSPLGYEINIYSQPKKYANLQYIQGYMKINDWKNIIIRNSEGNLDRCESRNDLWIKWKHIYSTFDETKNFIYSLYNEKPIMYNTSKKGRRETIPQNVKDKVWQRDNGTCVKCGSKEKLEFDHIIPFSKGGSSTYRNIQLLCESCNRKKYNNL